MSRKPPGAGRALPFQEGLRDLLEKFRRKDVNKFFEDPVDIRDVPEYYEHIKHPMCFSAMEKKIDTQQYSELESFKTDFKLICENCKFFNEKSTVYYKAAEALMRAGKTLFANCNLEQPLSSSVSTSSVSSTLVQEKAARTREAPQESPREKKEITPREKREITPRRVSPRVKKEKLAEKESPQVHRPKRESPRLPSGNDFSRVHTPSTPSSLYPFISPLQQQPPHTPQQLSQQPQTPQQTPQQQYTLSQNPSPFISPANYSSNLRYSTSQTQFMPQDSSPFVSPSPNLKREWPDASPPHLSPLASSPYPLPGQTSHFSSYYPSPSSSSHSPYPISSHASHALPLPALEPHELDSHQQNSLQYHTREQQDSYRQKAKREEQENNEDRKRKTPRSSSSSSIKKKDVASDRQRLSGKQALGVGISFETAQPPTNMDLYHLWQMEQQLQRATRQPAATRTLQHCTPSHTRAGPVMYERHRPLQELPFVERYLERSRRFVKGMPSIVQELLEEKLNAITQVMRLPEPEEAGYAPSRHLLELINDPEFKPVFQEDQPFGIPPADLASLDSLSELGIHFTVHKKLLAVQPKPEPIEQQQPVAFNVQADSHGFAKQETKSISTSYQQQSPFQQVFQQHPGATVRHAQPYSIPQTPTLQQLQYLQQHQARQQPPGHMQQSPSHMQQSPSHLQQPSPHLASYMPQSLGQMQQPNHMQQQQSNHLQLSHLQQSPLGQQSSAYMQASSAHMQQPPTQSPAHMQAAPAHMQQAQRMNSQQFQRGSTLPHSRLSPMKGSNPYSGHALAIASLRSHPQNAVLPSAPNSIQPSLQSTISRDQPFR